MRLFKIRRRSDGKFVGDQGCQRWLAVGGTVWHTRHGALSKLRCNRAFLMRNADDIELVEFECVEKEVTPAVVIFAEQLVKRR